MSEKRGSIVGSLIAGVVAGAVGALLLAPKAGRETRDLVKKKGGEYISALREKLGRRRSDTDHSDPHH